MAAGYVAVVGVGMITAVGLSAAETAASARAGTMRFTESDFYDKNFDPFVLAQVPDDGLPPLAESLDAAPPLTARERRMLRLAARALVECVAPLSAGRAGEALTLCLALPETETTRPLDRKGFLGALAVQCRGAFDPARSDASHTGRAGGLAAVGQAVIAINAGQMDVVLAGGVDTFRDGYVLGTLDRDARVKSAANLDGFVPGEGAGFVLLASASGAARRGLTPLAQVSPAAIGHEPGHLNSPEPYRGNGLAATLGQLVASRVVQAPIADVYSCMNGENHWAKEWGVGYLRNRAVFHESHGMHHPADAFGDTGAACGPIMIGLAALGVRAGYRRAPALVYGSSDSGPRAAVVVSAAGH